MSTNVQRVPDRQLPALVQDSSAPDDATYVVRPSQAQAREASRFVATWIDRVRVSGAHRVIIDMSAVHRLDLSGFGVLLAKLRDVLRVSVQLTDVGVSEAVSLRSMGLVDGVVVQQRRSR